MRGSWASRAARALCVLAIVAFAGGLLGCTGPAADGDDDDDESSTRNTTVILIQIGGQQVRATAGQGLGGGPTILKAPSTTSRSATAPRSEPASRAEPATPSPKVFWWQTTRAPEVYVTISVDGSPEKLFAEGREGRKEVPSYRPTSRYEFKLYADRALTQLLDTKSYGPS